MAKVNRHNHPLMVNARKESYYAGRSDGYKEGYEKGYSQRCEDLTRYYATIIEVLDSKLNTLREVIKLLEAEVKKHG